MTSTLSGKTALVTGSSRGIGRATALGLAREGALAAVHYGRDKQAAQQTVDLIEKDGGRAFAVGAELGTPGAVDQLFDQLEAGLREHTGETVLDILVNNAAATMPVGSAPAGRCCGPSDPGSGPSPTSRARPAASPTSLSPEPRTC